jgi:hypothetical protein
VAILTRFSAVLGLLGSAALVSAQDRTPSTLSEAGQTAEKRTNEWSILASNLEQRVLRMLPCDPRVRASIEEVSRASGARFLALTAYWQESAKRSNDQAESARGLIADNDARLEDWKADSADSEQEQARVEAQTSDLRETARQAVGLAAAARLLNGISQNMAAAVKQGVTREQASIKLDGDLNEWITASQARQAAIEDELKALAAENTRYTAFYAARITRAQLECSLTGAAGNADPPPAPRTPKKAAK